ncbi:hypothetical protein LTS02_017738 [Friedmanniomyces endolithicus]|nr:hypothetical protein LTS02_017738 [Friedmanniomyces endolithicus]
MGRHRPAANDYTFSIQPDDASSDGVGEEYRQREADFDEVSATQRPYAKGSKSLLNGVQQQWLRCSSPARVLRLKYTEPAAASLFFHFLLAHRRQTLRHTSTLQTYWNTLCLVRRRETGLMVIETHVKDGMVGVPQQLGVEFGLETEKQAKPIARAEDEYALLTTLWSSPSLTLDHERLRVQLALIAQLAGITGNRPGALLALRYGDIKVTLLRDPLGTGMPKVTLGLKFPRTKTYRVPKDPCVFRPCFTPGTPLTSRLGTLSRFPRSFSSA